MKETDEFLNYQLPLLKELKPYAGGIRGIKTPEEYILKYFKSFQKKTYTKGNVMQCTGGRRRSFLDIYYLTKARFPDITQEEVASILIKLIIAKERNSHIVITYCSYIKKVVFHFSSYAYYPINVFKLKRKYYSATKTFSYYSYDDRNYPIDNITEVDILNLANKHIKSLNKKK